VTPVGRRRLLAALLLAGVVAPTPGLALSGAVIVRSDTLERGALDPWVVLVDGSRLDLEAVDLALSAAAHEPGFLVSGNVETSRVHELPFEAGKTLFDGPDGKQDELAQWIAPHGSLAFWPGGSEAGDPADAASLVVVRPGGAAFEIHRKAPGPVPEPGVLPSLVAGAALLHGLARRARRPTNRRRRRC